MTLGRMSQMFLSRFLRAREGNVATMFAFAIIPVIGLPAQAVDYSRAASARTGMQSAIDATALAMAKLAPTPTQSELQQKTTAYFSAMFSHPEAKNIVVTPTYSTTGGSQLTIAASGSVDATFMKIIGFNNLNIGSTSTVKWGNTRLRVALVLDNTGSMAEAGKIDALKTASKNLLTQLKTAAATNGDVYVSIIPFNKDVNVGKNNYTSSIRWDLWDSNSNSGGNTFSGSICFNGTLWQVNGTSWTNGGSCSGQSSGICFQGTLWNWNGVTFTSGGSCSGHGNWNGCVTDRDQDYDTQNTAPSASVQATLFPAEQY